MKGKNRKADFMSAFFKCSFQSILLAIVFFEKGIFMEIKFKDKMDSYKYLVMFDLASKVTGVCVWNIAKKEPLCTAVIRVKDGTELPAAELKTRINALFDELDKEIGRENYFVSKEMMPTQIHGGCRPSSPWRKAMQFWMSAVTKGGYPVMITKGWLRRPPMLISGISTVWVPGIK